MVSLLRNKLEEIRYENKKEYLREYYQKRKSKFKQYYLANKSKINNYSLKYYLINKEKINNLKQEMYYEKLRSDLIDMVHNKC